MIWCFQFIIHIFFPLLMRLFLMIRTFYGAYATWRGSDIVPKSIFKRIAPFFFHALKIFILFIFIKCICTQWTSNPQPTAVQYMDDDAISIHKYCFYRLASASNSAIHRLNLYSKAEILFKLKLSDTLTLLLSS